MQDRIPVTLITDNMVGFVMANGLVDKVVVGADRILMKSGYVINKIGTLTVAVAASYFHVPFIVAAPCSTIDRETELSKVVIERRNPREVAYVGSQPIAPRGVPALNPAFDITPPELVTAIVTEKGVFRPDKLRKTVSA